MMKEKIIEILKDVLEENSVNENTTQQNCPTWDSLHHLNVAVELEDAFDVTLEPEEIADMKSVADIERILSNKLEK